MVEISEFKLLNMLLTLSAQERAVIAHDETFDNIRSAISRQGSFFDIESEKEIAKQLETSVKVVGDCIMDHLCFVKHTNQAMSNFIKNQISNATPHTNPIKIASVICALGNAEGDVDVSEGLGCLLKRIGELKEDYFHAIENREPLEALNLLADQLVEVFYICQAVTTFTMAKYGAVKGVGEHFGQNVAETPSDTGDAATDHTDTFKEDTDNSVDGMEHLLTLLIGAEHFIQGTETPTYEQRYALGVIGYDLERIDGMEGAMWDKVQAGLKKLFENIKTGLVSIKENYLDKSIEAIADDVRETADVNKKAINASKEKSAVLNETAKAGINNLAAKTGNEEIKTIAATLTTLGTASGVIDKLLVVFNKKYSEAQALQTEFNNVDKMVRDLEKESGGTPPSDEDKEAISVKKAAMTEKSKELNAKFTELKKKFAAHRKEVAAIAKAIKGIVPGIFTIVKEEQKK